MRGNIMNLRIFLAGDSTVAYNDITSYPQTGWGQAIHLYLSPDVQILNYAKNGRSSKSFIEEGLLEEINQCIGEGDLLLIQFGHNDQKEEASKHTEPYSTYQAYLRQYIDVARRHGATPILITPLYRRHFDKEGRLKDKVHGEYPEAMKALAQELGVDLIDLCKESKELFETLGDAGSKSLFMHLPPGTYKAYPEGKEDDTHMTYDGAVKIAGIVYRGLERIVKNKY